MLFLIHSTSNLQTMNFTAFFLLFLKCQVKACTYIWETQVLNCHGQDLFSVPLGYPRGAKLLLMSDNYISKISADVCNYYGQVRTLVIRGNPFNCSQVCPGMDMVCDIHNTSTATYTGSTGWTSESHTSTMDPHTRILTSTFQTSAKEITLPLTTTTINTTAAVATTTTTNMQGKKKMVISLSVSIPSGLSIEIGITVYILKIKQRMSA